MISVEMTTRLPINAQFARSETSVAVFNDGLIRLSPCLPFGAITIIMVSGRIAISPIYAATGTSSAD